MDFARIENGNIVVKLAWTTGDEFAKKLQLIKELPERRWNADRKVWIVPATRIGIENVEAITGLPVEGREEVRAEKELTQEEQRAIITSLADTPLFPYQKEGVAFLCSRERALLADDMGIGKSVQAIYSIACEPRKRYPALIVCPASLKVNWQREWSKWVNVPAAIVTNGKEWKVTKEAKVVIVNYDILGKHLKSIKAFGFNTIVCDESHALKNMRTARYKAVKAAAAGIRHFVALSGTPIENRPVEFFSVLQMIDPDRFGSFWRFAQRYCDAHHNGFGWDFSGSSNAEELYDLLNGSVMLRRKKEDVLNDLPPKQRFSVPLDAVTVTLPESFSERPAIEQLNFLKQATAREKLPQAIEWLETMLESGNKMIAFAVHHEIIDAIMARFGDIAVKLDGRDNQDQRTAAVDRFQNDETVRLFVGNIQAAGVGITLTKATHVAFIELDWKPGTHVQAEDRAHRIGQQECVTCWYLIAADSIEEDIFDLLYRKKQVIDAVLDGGMPESETIIGALAKKYCGGKE